MSLSVVVLGPGGVRLECPAAHEQPEGGIRGLDAMLAARPDLAIVTGRAEPCFFRASLALERGVERVVVHRAALAEHALAQLAWRARAFGGRLYLHGDRVGEHKLVPTPARPSDRAIGCPDLEPWSHAVRATADDPVTRAELGWRLSPEQRSAWRGADPLALDTATAGFPVYFEELAWSAGLKPVLYLVLPAAEATALRARHPDAHALEVADRLDVDGTTGARQYGRGAAVVHLFLSRDGEAAERARTLWTSGSGQHVRELGALMGYPRCCVAAFEAFEQRGHNAALVYLTRARTLALGAPFHPLLNGVGARLVPFTPCTYGCPSAIAWAERLLAALPATLATQARRALGRAVLYFDQARAVVLEARAAQGRDSTGPAEPTERDARPNAADEGAQDGTYALTVVRFSTARWVRGEGAPDAPGAMHARQMLGGLLSGGGVLQAGAEALEVHGDDGSLRRLERGKPRLGVLLPFAPPPTVEP